MAKILPDCVSPETAYIVKDYPWGFKLRCQMRTWIETAKKGAKRGQQRPVFQTQHPTTGQWNKPNPGPYHEMTILVLDDKGLVQADAIASYMEQVKIAEWRLLYYFDMSQDQRERFQRIEVLNARYHRASDNGKH